MAVAIGQIDLPCAHCHTDPQLQRQNGCLTDSPIPDRWQIGKYTFQRCPGQLVTRQSADYIKAYNWMKRNQLPGGLPWDQQSVKFLQAMDVIEAEIVRQQKEEMERAKRGV